MKFRTDVEPPEPMRGLEVPPEVVESLGQGKRPRVTITVNGRAIEAAKKPETRIRRIEKTLSTLRNLESAGGSRENLSFDVLLVSVMSI